MKNLGSNPNIEKSNDNANSKDFFFHYFTKTFNLLKIIKNLTKLQKMR